MTARIMCGPRLAALERDRDHYRDEVHSLNEKMRGMTSAASSAAASTVIAIDRIQELLLVVDAAVAWSKTSERDDYSAHHGLASILLNRVAEYVQRTRGRS